MEFGKSSVFFRTFESTESVLFWFIFQDIKLLIIKRDYLYFLGVFLSGRKVEFGKSSGRVREKPNSLKPFFLQIVSVIWSVGPKDLSRYVAPAQCRVWESPSPDYSSVGTARCIALTELIFHARINPAFRWRYIPGSHLTFLQNAVPSTSFGKPIFCIRTEAIAKIYKDSDFCW